MVHMPEALVQKWFHDAQHGEAFREIIDQLSSRYGSLEELKSQAAPNAGKRPGVAGSAAPAAKRLKFSVSPDKCIAAEKMIGTQVAQVSGQQTSHTDLFEVCKNFQSLCSKVPLQNIRMPKDTEPLSLSIRDDNSIYLVNPSGADDTQLKLA